MGGGIQGVESMGQYGDCRNPGVECGAVSCDIYAVGESADDYSVGAELCGEVGYEIFDERDAVGCSAACAYNTDYVWRVKRRFAEGIEE